MKYKCLEKMQENNKKPSKLLRILNKGLSAVLIGLIALIVMEYSPKFKEFMHNEVLEKNISFGYIGKLYNKFFGEVLPSTNENIVQVFKEKITYQEKEPYENGYKLTVLDNYLVPVIESGVVVYIGEKEGLGNVLVIEGEDGSTITYGNIKNSDVKLYEYINSGKYLGEANGNYLYLIILKDGEYLDIETYLS
jgi:stage IV sporulation protein FA